MCACPARAKYRIRQSLSRTRLGRRRSKLSGHTLGKSLDVVLPVRYRFALVSMAILAGSIIGGAAEISRPFACRAGGIDFGHK